MSVTATPSGARIGVQRLRLYAVAALTAQYSVLAIWAVRRYGLHDPQSPMVGDEFVIFWAAARVALEHGAPAIFSPDLMRPIESALWWQDSFSPCPYPPTFLLLIIPFGLLSFGGALIAFFGAGIATYMTMMSKLARACGSGTFLAMAAFPGVAVALATGQNSLFTAAAAGGALALLPASPILAGACIAALVIKPQFGILIPIALIFGRQWMALASAAVCSVVIIVVSTALFGFKTWQAFAAFLPEFNRFAVVHGRELWSGMPTVFAALRLAGSPIGVAYAAHALVALPAVFSMAYLWIKGARFELRAAALVTATLVAQPYFLFYDLVWLALPIVFLLRDAETVALSRFELAVIAAAWLMPAVEFFTDRARAPIQLGPVVLIALLAIIIRRHFAAPSRSSSPLASAAAVVS